MTRLISLVFAAVFMLAACNNNKSKETSNNSDSSKNGKETVNNNTGTNTQQQDMAKLMEEMKKKPALSTDQLKAMLPEEMMGMKRSSFSANSMMGFGMGEAHYKSDDGKEIKVAIWDCVGEAGVGYYNLMFWGMNMESQDDNGYKKTITFNGGKAIESYEKNQDKYGITFGSGNRLLVNVEGEKTGLDAVKQVAQSLNLQTN
jgi:hypothetical protein